MAKDWRPNIVAFVCNWCAYAGADDAGGKRLAYPSSIRLVRVMCSGRVAPQAVLDAFRQGADGVMVLGCHPGDCHYRTGNLRAEQRMKLLAQLLDTVGIDSRRFVLDWVSAKEGSRFQEVATTMEARIRELGPLHPLPSRSSRKES